MSVLWGEGGAVAASGRAADATPTTLGHCLWVPRAPGSPSLPTQEAALPTAPPVPGPGVTWTGPPDPPAQTAAALACCCRRPPPTRRPAAPSPFRPRRTPPCCPRAAEAAAPAQTWALRRKGQGGEERPGQSAPCGPGGALRARRHLLGQSGLQGFNPEDRRVQGGQVPWNPQFRQQDCKAFAQQDLSI